MDTSVCTYADAESVVCTTLCSDKDCTLGSTATIENNCLSTLKESDLGDLCRKDIVGRTWNTVDKHEISLIVVTVHTPERVAIETAYISLHVVKAVCIIVL